MAFMAQHATHTIAVLDLQIRSNVLESTAHFQVDLKITA
jgi:hypothetical protein